jgi:hypothetical protein
VSIYKELNDREWLIENYEKKLRSCLNISKELGCNNNAVRQALIKHNISVRNPSQAQLTHSTTDLKINRSVLDGSLMGDAFLHKWRKSDKSLACLLKKNKNLDHLTWFANYFEDSPKIKQVDHYLKATEKSYMFYVYRTTVDPQLEEYYKRWYPESNNYKKIIPDDIIIDEMFLLHWFLDDGYSHLRDRTNEFLKIGKGWTSKTKQVTLGFCTECFELDQQQILCNKINEKYEIGISPRKIVWKNSKGNMEGYRLFLPQLKTNKFFDIIGECPIESLKYKWKII